MGKLTITRFDNPVLHQAEYKITIPMLNLVGVKLDHIDRALLDDINSGVASNTPVADVLLGLQTLVYRIEQQTKEDES